MRSTHSIHLLLLVVGGLAAWPQLAHCARADGLKAHIIRTADARDGLHLHIGCGDRALTAAMAKSGRYLVHGLSSDEEQVQRARNRILSQKLYGVASVS